MKPTLLILCVLALSASQGVLAVSPSSLAEAEAALIQTQQRCDSAQASYGEVLAAEREVLTRRVEAASAPARELLAQLDTLWQRQEEYLTRCLDGGVIDRFTMNDERIQLLSLRLRLERRAGVQNAETHKRLRSLYEGNLALYERLYQSGLVPVDKVEAARRALADFLAAE